MIMNKIVGMAALLLCLTGCVRDNDAIYYPVGDVDIEEVWRWKSERGMYW